LEKIGDKKHCSKQEHLTSHDFEGFWVRFNEQPGPVVLELEVDRIGQDGAVESPGLDEGPLPILRILLLGPML
jgi:hypothetical protein